MGLRPAQGDENQSKGTAFRPSINDDRRAALAAEGICFSTERSEVEGPAFSASLSMGRASSLFPELGAGVEVKGLIVRHNRVAFRLPRGQSAFQELDPVDIYLRRQL